jgi:hypothetical protein
MPDYFEEALGYDKSKDDAMTKESDGYVRIEKYINWLGAMHATAAGGKSLDFDLRTITRGFKDVSPTYSVSAAENGTVELAGDGYTARFAPRANFSGLASFKYTVKGNDNTEYTGRVEVLVEKSAGADTSTTVIRDLRRARPADMRGATHKEYRDLKGRRFDRQIPYRVMF